MIIVTGAAGFIGSCMVQLLNDNGFDDLILVDDFSASAKENNWKKKRYKQIIDRKDLFNWLNLNNPQLDIVIHLGARTDTTEFNYAIHEELNVKYSEDIWNYCSNTNTPLIYASSAATYGAGELGYNDDHKIVEKLAPLNPYGISKNEFDKWALKQNTHPPYWAGLKFFNIYGPNEYHKGRMASVIWHSFNQVKDKGKVNLFKSHRPDFKDGEQLRDFVYVKDLLKVMYWMMVKMTNKQWNVNDSGLYNLGTGKARTFYDLVSSVFRALDMHPDINFIDMPEDIRDKYQYFTEANMTKLYSIGYNEEFYTIENGIDDYVKNYLSDKSYY